MEELKIEYEQRFDDDQKPYWVIKINWNYLWYFNSWTWDGDLYKFQTKELAESAIAHLEYLLLLYGNGHYRFTEDT